MSGPYMSFLPCSPWIREGLSLGAIMAARMRAGLESVCGPGSGISMSSLWTGVNDDFSCSSPGDWKRARFF